MRASTNDEVISSWNILFIFSLSESRKREKKTLERGAATLNTIPNGKNLVEWIFLLFFFFFRLGNVYVLVLCFFENAIQTKMYVYRINSYRNGSIFIIALLSPFIFFLFDGVNRMSALD